MKASAIPYRPCKIKHNFIFKFSISILVSTFSWCLYIFLPFFLDAHMRRLWCGNFHLDSFSILIFSFFPFSSSLFHNTVDFVVGKFRCPPFHIIYLKHLHVLYFNNWNHLLWVCFFHLSFLALRSTLASCYFHIKVLTFISSLLFSCSILLNSQHCCVGKFHLSFLWYFHVLLCIIYFKRISFFFSELRIARCR